jgi:hypothetical protein
MVYGIGADGVLPIMSINPAAANVNAVPFDVLFKESFLKSACVCFASFCH